MEVYLVGGAVRDALMGRSVQDRDWVVVGATPQNLLDQGFVAVGRDFPVFLHPRTHEEYALARTERKTAPGYRGFAVHAAPEVTLEEDLARRDLTINSIAVRAYSTGVKDLLDAELSADAASWDSTGTVVDPHNGRGDIAAKVLRHVTPAFREDPVRILRVARFAARFDDFTVAFETRSLLQEMVQSGEADHLVPERVWQELSTGLMEAQPQHMFEVLRDCGALERLLPHMDTGARALQALTHAARQGCSLAVRYACLARAGDLSACKTQALALRVPAACSELATVLVREEDALAATPASDAAATVALLERCDAFRKPERFSELLQVAACRDVALPATHLQKSLEWVQAVATDLVAADAHSAGASGPEVGQMIRQARVNAVAAGLALGML